MLNFVSGALEPSVTPGTWSVLPVFFGPKLRRQQVPQRDAEHGRLKLEAIPRKAGGRGGSRSDYAGQFCTPATLLIHLRSLAARYLLLSYRAVTCDHKCDTDRPAKNVSGEASVLPCGQYANGGP